MALDNGLTLHILWYHNEQSSYFDIKYLKTFKNICFRCHDSSLLQFFSLKKWVSPCIIMDVRHLLKTVQVIYDLRIWNRVETFQPAVYTASEHVFATCSGDWPQRRDERHEELRGAGLRGLDCQVGWDAAGAQVALTVGLVDLLTDQGGRRCL